jgi:quercetin dioxygenase-like cupin family protein
MTMGARVIDNADEPILESGPGCRSRLLAGALHGTGFMSVVERWISPGAEVPTHRHPEGVEEVIWVRGGNGEFWVDDEQATLAEDTTIIVPPLRRHGFRAVGDETLWLFSRYSAATPMTLGDDGSEGAPEVPGAENPTSD